MCTVLVGLGQLLETARQAESIIFLISQLFLMRLLPCIMVVGRLQLGSIGGGGGLSANSLSSSYRLLPAPSRAAACLCARRVHSNRFVCRCTCTQWAASLQPLEQPGVASLLLIMVGKFRYQLTLAAAAFNVSASLPSSPSLSLSISLSLFLPLSVCLWLALCGVWLII